MGWLRGPSAYLQVSRCPGRQAHPLHRDIQACQTVGLQRYRGLDDSKYFPRRNRNRIEKALGRIYRGDPSASQRPADLQLTYEGEARTHPAGLSDEPEGGTTGEG